MAAGAQQQPLSMAELVDKLARLEKDMAETKAEVTQTKAEITQNTTHINTINTKLDKAGTRVAFTAVGTDRTKKEPGEPIVFPDVMVEIGGGYDRTTGVFKAPVAGTYIFSASMRKHGNIDYVVAEIMVDNDKYVDITGNLTSNGSSSVSVQLGVGQTVWVKACSNPKHYISSSTCFTGALVQPQL